MATRICWVNWPFWQQDTSHSESLRCNLYCSVYILSDRIEGETTGMVNSNGRGTK